MKVVVTLTLIALALAGVLYWQYTALEQLRGNLVFIKTEPPGASIEEQEKCAAQAENAIASIVSRYHYNVDTTVTSTNHYNDRLNICFATLEALSTRPPRNPVARNIFLLNASEERLIGHFSDVIGASDKPTCQILSAEGVDTKCNSLGEFEILLRQYME